MTTPSSLEHCYTNLFALANIDGIRWKCFSSGQPIQRAHLAWDPVITAYLQCIENGILAVWRRVPLVGASKRPSQFEKELWVFWFEEEPSNVPNSPDLNVRSVGRWDEGGLSYECRILIFKAYHNIIERCLLRKGFARFGRWFILPADVDLPHMPQLAFAFEFFLHGDSRVCAIVDVEERAPVRRVRQSDLALAASKNIPVILSPFGISARLIAQNDLEPKLKAQIPRIKQEWSQFYPDPGESDGEELQFIDVAIGNENLPAPTSTSYFRQSEFAKVMYPMLYTFVADMDSFEEKRRKRHVLIESTENDDALFDVMMESLLSECLKQPTHGTTSADRCECGYVQPRSQYSAFHHRIDDTMSPSSWSVHSPLSSVTTMERTPAPPSSSVYNSPFVAATTPVENPPTPKPAKPRTPCSQAIKSEEEGVLDEVHWPPRKHNGQIQAAYNLSCIENNYLSPLSHIDNKAVQELYKSRNIKQPIAHLDAPFHSPDVLTPPKSNLDEESNGGGGALCEIHQSNDRKLTETTRSIPPVDPDELLTPPHSHNPQYVLSPMLINDFPGDRALADLKDWKIVDDSDVLYDRLLRVVKVPKISYKPTLFRSQRKRLRLPILPPAIEGDASSSEAQNNDRRVAPLCRLRADGLAVNLSLVDSCLNFFRDLNFDSCPMCACVRSVSDSIRGADILPYLTGQWHTPPINSCSCGYRATVSYSLASDSGMNIEDEFELVEHCTLSSTGIGKPLAPETIDQVQRLFSNPFSTTLFDQLMCSHRSRYGIRIDLPPGTSGIHGGHVLDAIALAYKHGREAYPGIVSTKHSFVSACEVQLHPWLSSGLAVRADLEVSRLLWQIKPLLQQVLQKKHVVAKLWDTMVGPLTWRHFTQLLRTEELPVLTKSKLLSEDVKDINEQTCEPLNIPRISIGCSATSSSDIADAPGLSASPFILKFWANQSLKPISEKRDVAFVAILPSSADRFSSCSLSRAACSFFVDLTCRYEQLKLGLHRPAASLAHLDNWPMGMIPTENKSIEQILQTYIVDKLKDNNEIDQSIFKCTSTANDMFSIGLPALSAPNSEQDRVSKFPPAIVVYVVAPMGNALKNRSLAETLAKFTRAMSSLPKDASNKIYLQPISLGWLLRHDRIRSEILQSICLSLYSRQIILQPRPAQIKRLTDFGPRPNDVPETEGPHQFLYYRAPYFLADCLSELSGPILDMISTEKAQRISVDNGAAAAALLPSIRLQAPTIFCTYCPSADQRYWLASCCDENGLILETCVINLNVTDSRASGCALSIQQRLAQKEAFRFSRRAGQTRLWDFILSIVGRLCCPCRLVINRFGRLGQNELRGWACLLGKRYLKQITANFLQRCEGCSFQQELSERPSILSACLTSFEPHFNLRVLPDAVCEKDTTAAGLDRRPAGSSKVSCTHILTFPISAFVQPRQRTSNQNDPGLHDFDELLFGGLDMDVSDMGPLMSPPLSPTTRYKSEMQESSQETKTSVDILDQSYTLKHLIDHEENVQLDQQPLAIGLYVSTAPAAHLPSWARRRRRGYGYEYGGDDKCNTFKVSLHLNVPCAQESDEVLLKSTVEGQSPYFSRHPLDSSTTFVALRYVLEQFHRLSWLLLDSRMQDRRSCLPINIDVLLRLYHSLDILSSDNL